MSKLRMFKVEIPVDYDQAWADAIRQGAPSTDSGWPIWGVEDQFPTDQKGTVAEKLRFVQFGPSFYRQAVLDYAKSEGGVTLIHPRSIFGTTERHPKIADEQDEEVMYLNSALTCTVVGDVFVPHVECYRDGYRFAYARDVGFGFGECSWFGFRE